MPTVLRSPLRRLPLSALCLGALWLSLLCLAPLAQAATLNVPSASYLTIQSAVDAAANGDTVLVADGTFSGPGNRDIDFNGKSITVTSKNGPTKTIIDCGGSSSTPHRAFYFHTNEANAIINSLTIENCYENSDYTGGSVYISGGANVTITDCTFNDNTVAAYGGRGGGVYNNGTVTVTRCIFSDNAAPNVSGGGAGGGGIFSNGTVTLTKCIFNNNTAASGGGATCGGVAMLTDCTFSYNTASYGPGGGVDCNGTVTLANCDFSYNTASYTGGGGLFAGYAPYSTVTLANCSFSNNVASNNGIGGGVYNDLYDGSLTLTNCTLSNNMASSSGGVATDNDSQATLTDCMLNSNSATNGYGGGIGVYRATATLINCAVFNNTTTNGNGGGVYNDNNGKLTLQSCTLSGNSTHATDTQGGAMENDGTATLTDDILWDDTASAASEIGSGTSGNPMTTVTYCDVQGGYVGTGNIDADPLFVNSPTDLHLQFGSPCLGAGTANGAPTTTLDGYTRPNPPSIGAYELLTPTISSLSPTSAYAGGGSLTLTVNGTGFVSGARVKFGTTSLVTTFVSGTQMTATLTSALRATVGAYTIKVINPGGRSSNSKTFTVKPRLTGLTLSASRVSGGQTVTGTVTLNGPAPTGGVTILLTSSDTARATVPASVTVAAGATSATFPITTLAVTTTGSTTITANGAGGTPTATLTVLAPVTPTADTFGQDGSAANTNYGTTNPLLVKTATSPGTDRDSYLQFSLGGLTTVTSAKLQVTAYLSGTGSLTTGVYGTSSAWMESGLTWNNKPALGSTLGSFTATTTTNTVYIIDVTAYVQSQLTSGTVSFGLHNPSASTIVTRLLSREAGSGAAQLVITGN